ncbi:hypothetical protein WICPIJ_003606 [Wickerhamomyces pijperi]|uniref:cAMP-dependent protein kinase regulatory subunit n=1 Tax=Wickerhamomyces pijperi TaxID=599730 RepID=A0A9P8Q7I9_WICPI|nr:hypothetical protein WICPIJ_003606 [Wickerhamomyces pijperi]
MSLPKEYLTELNELNKELHLKKPQDVIQFCATYFQNRLEEQRKQLWNLQPRAQSIGLNLFPSKHERIEESSPLLFKQPFTNDDPHSRHVDEDGDTQISTDDPASSRSGSSAPAGGIFKTGFEVGEENKSFIANSVDPSTPFQFNTRRASNVVQVNQQQLQQHNIPTTFNINRRTSVSAETLNPNGIKDDWKPPVFEKSPEQLQRLSNSVVKNFLFSSLDQDSLSTVIAALKEVKLPANTEVIKQGDEGDYFYIVEEGSVDFYVNGAKVNNSGPGSSFGELALMYNSPRAATATAETDLILWALDRLTFRRILLAKTSKKRQLYESFLKEVPVLNNLSLFERSKLADALDTEFFKPGEVIIKEGEVGENFYLLSKGEAEVSKESDGVIAQLKRGDYFGEVALLNDLPRQATVTAKTNVEVATLDKRGFQRLLGPAVEVLKRQDPTKH